MKNTLILFIVLASSLVAQTQAPDPDPAQATREDIVDDLMNAPDPASLTKAIAAGKSAGLPEQMFLEAQFIYFVNQNDQSSLAEMAPLLEKHLPKYSSDDTMLFAVKEDYQSIVEYTKALAALGKKDLPLFKKHITEAFWLSPAHAVQFAPHIEEVRLQQAMKDVALDLTRTFENQKNGDSKTSLKDVLGDAPALVLHFWSPWVQPSMDAMPEIAIVSKLLLDNGLPVTSILLGGTAESRQDAATYLATEGKDNPGKWLIDSTKNALASQLRIASFPTIVLVNQEGRILFNGDPVRREFWSALAKINPKITPPTIDPVLKNEGPKSDKTPAPSDQ